MNESERPLATIALLTYNQERYIREAVEGALAQDYSPLEIILSDDCSTDRTFNIIRELSESYKGPAALNVRRNERNLGLSGHINEVMKTASGELIVVAAGDDISLPTRVSENVKFYIASGKPDSIFSDYIDIDESGDEVVPRPESAPFEQSIEEFIDSPAIKGAAHAWSRRVFEQFGPLSSDVLCEDQVIPFRAYLLKRPRLLNLRLVKYRRVDRVTDRTTYFRRHYRRQLTSRAQYLKDLRARSSVGKDLEARIERQLELCRVQDRFWTSGWIAALSVWPALTSKIGCRASLLELGRKAIG